MSYERRVAHVKKCKPALESAAAQLLITMLRKDILLLAPDSSDLSFNMHALFQVLTCCIYDVPTASVKLPCRRRSDEAEGGLQESQPGKQDSWVCRPQAPARLGRVLRR